MIYPKIGEWLATPELDGKEITAIQVEGDSCKLGKAACLFHNNDKLGESDFQHHPLCTKGKHCLGPNVIYLDRAGFGLARLTRGTDK